MYSANVMNSYIEEKVTEVNGSLFVWLNDPCLLLRFCLDEDILGGTMGLKIYATWLGCRSDCR